MTETGDAVTEIDGSVAPEHDHAWRRVSDDQHSPGRLGIYRCDICSSTWSL
jgi:hypothetical protein